MRDGSRQEIDARELVPTDLKLLEPGGRVPADHRPTASEDMRCDESLLTVESAPVKKVAVGSAADHRDGAPSPAP